MTSSEFCGALTSIVADLSRDLPSEVRYKRLLDAMQSSFPCDAAALLKLENNHLTPLAVDGLSDDTMGRRFEVEEHPRLARLLHSREPVRFAADSDLPDPYDGLVETEDQLLHVHDCMGSSLYLDDKPWGVITMDALQTGTFDQIDPIELRTFISLTEATVKAAQRIDELEARVERGHRVARALIKEGSEVEIVGKSPVMKKLREEIDVVAQSDLTVLIQGETGVGKELVARQVHANSPRADYPMVYVNCAALPENIAESELFGHTRGAFTGATADRAGKFELADGGTLFLDEIGELSLGIQAKMLRAIQSGEIQRVGSDQPVRADVRIVAATNRDMQKEVSAGRFRADLYHRLTVYPLRVPPLRERGKDILLIAGYFLENNQHRLSVNALRLSAGAKQALLYYTWPGNVRELAHMLSRAALKAVAKQGNTGGTVIIDTSHLDIDDTEAVPRETAKTEKALPVVKVSLRETVDQFQREIIADSLKRHDGNLASAGRELGISRSNFYRLLKRLDLHQENPA
ncbi:MAG TPA: nitric oxide reductase transcriptional regulator NorR [Gammaproteobacteria bacterium]|nr:nitric oxide reductase transcriptional regulator NorR [Gammaproteobacteria bacterium]